MDKLKEKTLGISGGLVCSFILFFITILSSYTGYASKFLAIVADLYPGYSISIRGSFIGFIYLFIDAFCFFFLLAWIYNKLPQKKAL